MVEVAPVIRSDNVLSREESSYHILRRYSTCWGSSPCVTVSAITSFGGKLAGQLTNAAPSRWRPNACAVRTAAPSKLQHSVILRSKVRNRALYHHVQMSYELKGAITEALTKRRVRIISKESGCTATAMSNDRRAAGDYQYN
jgi:hypothetical protein